jgi:hypothetical protein
MMHIQRLAFGGRKSFMAASEVQMARRGTIQRGRLTEPVKLVLFSLLGYIAVFGMILLLQFTAQK